MIFASASEVTGIDFYWVSRPSAKVPSSGQKIIIVSKQTKVANEKDIMVKMQYTNKKMSALKSTEKSRVRPSFSIPVLLPSYAWTQIFQCFKFIWTIENEFTRTRARNFSCPLFSNESSLDLVNEKQMSTNVATKHRDI